MMRRARYLAVVGLFLFGLVDVSLGLQRLVPDMDRAGFYCVLLSVLWAGGLIAPLLPSRAKKRAEKLLSSLLTPEEYNDLCTTGYLSIASPHHPELMYRVPRERGLVDVYRNGTRIYGLCVGPAERLPDADVVIMHKLMIEGDEEEYLAEAIKQWPDHVR